MQQSGCPGRLRRSTDVLESRGSCILSASGLEVRILMEDAEPSADERHFLGRQTEQASMTSSASIVALTALASPITMRLCKLFTSLRRHH